MHWDNALTLCRDLQRGTIAATDVMEEIYARIDALNPQLNAIVNLLPKEQALLLAKQADETPIAERGPLHGLPMATKDSVAMQGFPTTFGFKPWANSIAKQDDANASRLRHAGAIFIGHTNMPEFGLGSHTFNELFGATLNPYDPTKTPGGSSGGAAVALAAEMLPLADGSDMGGSLRNPASFCNVVGLRPSIGRLPRSKGFAWFARLTTSGPMAKTVADTSLLFSIQAGPDPMDPISLPEPGTHFFDALVAPQNLQSYKIAYSPDLHGIPVAPEVSSVIAACADQFANLGAAVELAAPNLEQAMSVFQTQRAAGLALLGDQLDLSVPDWRKQAKETAVWNIEKGKALMAKDILKSELRRSQIYEHVAKFFNEYDALILPSAQVLPFNTDVDWVREINGEIMPTYIDWMEICCAITVTGLPSISVPAGFSASGLPIGVQIVGKPQGDLALLKIAHCFEQATQHYLNKPDLCANPQLGKL